MRFEALYLKAFGPFTEKELLLGDGQHGVHVIYGPNEAGKSSALRAVRALLFGVDERTDDNFVHDNRTLRVGARLRPAQGEPFTCFRRKGRKNTLLDASGNPMDEGVLAALLQGVDVARFSTLFGIDHVSLVAGGRALLEEHGREAEALFGSGLGSTAVHQVLETLDRDAQRLFAPKAKNAVVNALLSELRDLRRQTKEAMLPPGQWEEARGLRDQARAALEEADLELKKAQVRRSALERLRRTLPGLAQLADIERRRAELGPAPGLPWTSLRAGSRPCRRCARTAGRSSMPTVSWRGCTCRWVICAWTGRCWGRPMPLTACTHDWASGAETGSSDPRCR